jgi:hypothetical protein
MPVVALDKDGSLVSVKDVDSADGCHCPDCEQEFSHIRDAHERAGSHVCEHFVHQSATGGGCGESHIHLKMKAVAAEAAESTFSMADVEIERPIAGGEKVADVCVTFPDVFYPFGDGICIECQYKNKQKYIPGTELTYASQGYSTLWLREPQFDGYTVDLLGGELTKGWLTQIPIKAEWSGVTTGADVWPSEFHDFRYADQDTAARVPFEWIKDELRQRYQRGLQIYRASNRGNDALNGSVSYKGRRLRNTAHCPERFHKTIWKVQRAKEKLPSYSKEKLSRVERRLSDEALDLHCIGDSKKHVMTDGACVHCGTELWRLREHLPPHRVSWMRELDYPTNSY